MKIYANQFPENSDERAVISLSQDGRDVDINITVGSSTRIIGYLEPNVNGKLRLQLMAGLSKETFETDDKGFIQVIY